MKTFSTILFVLLAVSLSSCKKEKDYELVRMRINHYQQPINHQELFYGLSLIVQEEGAIGTGRWHCLENDIAGFEYQLGYIYDLEVEKKNIKNPNIDAPSVEYSLKRVIAKNQVSLDSLFTITLSIKYVNGFGSLVTKDAASNFRLLNATMIDCGNLCGDLSKNLEDQNGISGVFKHVNDTSILLVELKVE